MNDNSVLGRDVAVRENEYLREKYYKLRHSSGLDIYVFPKKLTASYAIFGTKYGSIDNRFRTAADDDLADDGFIGVPDGIAHFLEHKMFENSDGVDTFERFAKTGADANAYTSFRSTCYLFSCTENFRESLEILLDFVTSPYFTPETVQKEQGIIAQEIRMGEDNPGRALIFGLLGAMYEKNNVKIEIAGTVDSISHITAELLYRCYNTFYNLHNMALCVCGDVTVDEVRAAADKVLKYQPDPKIERVSAFELPEVVSKRFVRRMQVARPMFNIGVKNAAIPSDPDERMRQSAALSIINTMLFGASSEFYNSLYEEGILSTSFDCWCENNSDFSFVSLSGETDDPEVAYSRFTEYVEKLRAGRKLDDGEFERTKKVLLANFVKNFDSTEDIASNLIDFVFDGADLLSYGDILKGVTAEYAFELFDKLFREEFFAMASILPLETKEGDENK